MGMVNIPIKDLLDHKLKDEWYKLEPQKTIDAVSGDLHIRIQVKPKVKKSKVKKKRSELWTAVKEGNANLFREWIPKHSNWDERDNEDNTLLHLAARHDSFSENEDFILMELLKHPKVNATTADAEGNTPLHIFCRNYKNPGCAAFIQKYVEKGADLNARNLLGETPLHMAVFNTSLKVILAECLLKNGANPDIQNCENDTPVHYSINIGRSDLIKLLVAYNANFDIAG
jgi:ankyrin repeat protein